MSINDTVSQVSDVVHRPLVLLLINIPLNKPDIAESMLFYYFVTDEFKGYVIFFIWV